MPRRFSATGFVFSLFPLLVACGPLMRSLENKSCLGELETSHEVTFAAPAAQLIGQSVEFCAGGRTSGVYTVTIPDPYQDTSVRTTVYGSHDFNHEGEIRWDGSCDDLGRVKETEDLVPIALTSKSFAQYKLCYFDNTLENVAILQLSDGTSCPSGSTAQPVAVDDCSQLNK